ncbi:hypothetical protein M0813_28460 [Anaeramoeba flamelloides]|uniref:Uncharacterized protein n=1 Tax=Anaeramoeba flamelloides TaxID=1746091 RepID=A0ABQ8XTH0_9EUKA|nr:hypothetical protein M0813_28460 [Anaeramoeba flamelloides]
MKHKKTKLKLRKKKKKKRKEQTTFKTQPLKRGLLCFEILIPIIKLKIKVRVTNKAEPKTYNTNGKEGSYEAYHYKKLSEIEKHKWNEIDVPTSLQK